MKRLGLSDPPDLRIIVLGVLLLFTASLAVAALSDSPDPTDMRFFNHLSQKDERIARGSVGAVVAPSPINPHVIAPPVRFEVPLDACDSADECRQNTNQACNAAGYVGVKGETVQLTATSCSGDCSAGCNIHGCPQAIYNCRDEAEPEPDPDPKPDGEGDQDV